MKLNNLCRSLYGDIIEIRRIKMTIKAQSRPAAELARWLTCQPANLTKQERRSSYEAIER